VLCDASASLDFGQPTKLDTAKRLAAAVGYMALATSERAQLVVGSGSGAVVHPIERGRGGLPGFLRRLEGLEASGALELAGALDALAARASRAGLLVVISDFLDPGPWRAALSRAVAAGHELVLVQVLAKEELAPPHDGDCAFEDAETGAIVELVLDAASLEAYEARLFGLLHELAGFAKRHGATYVRMTSDEPLEPVLRRLVARTVDR